MPGPLSKAAPPPLTPAAQAQRRKQTRLVVAAVLTLIVLFVGWQAYEYTASAPQRAEGRVQAGIALMHPGSYEQAIAKFDEALDLSPGLWNAYLQRGLAKQNLGSLDAALTDLEKALELNNELTEARIARADIFGAKGDKQRLVEELTKVIEVKSDVSARYRRGSAYSELGRHQEAIEDFSWVIDQVRDAPFAYFARANSKRALGDVAGANADVEIAESFNRGIVQ